MKKHTYHTYHCHLCIFGAPDPNGYTARPALWWVSIKGYGAAIQEFRKLRARLMAEGKAPTEIREYWTGTPWGKEPAAKFSVGEGWAELRVYKTEIETVTK